MKMLTYWKIIIISLILLLPVVLGNSITVLPNTPFYTPEEFYFWNNGVWHPYIIRNDSSPSNGSQYTILLRNDKGISYYEIHDDPVGVRLYNDTNMLVSTSWFELQELQGSKYKPLGVISIDLDVIEYSVFDTNIVNDQPRKKGYVDVMKTSHLSNGQDLVEIYRLGFDGYNWTHKAFLDYTPIAETKLVWRLTGLPNHALENSSYYEYNISIGELILGWSDFYDLFDYADIQGSSGKLDVYTQPFSEPIYIDPDLSLTDAGSYWEIEYYDYTGSKFSIRIRESYNGGTSNSVQLGYDGQVSYNETYSTTQHFADTFQFQWRSGGSYISHKLENITLIELSETMANIRWDYFIISSNVNASGNMWCTIYNGTRHPYALFSFDLNITEPTAYPPAKNTDVVYEIEAHDGFFDDDASAEASNSNYWSNNAGSQWDVTNNNNGQAYGCIGSVSGNPLDNWYSWDIVEANTRYSKSFKSDDDYAYDIHNLNGTWWYTIYHNITGEQPWDQWEDGETVYNIITVNTGTDSDWDTNYTAYNIIASSNIANWTIDGTNSITYTTPFVITGLTNSSNMQLKNGTSVMSLGTQYYAHYNSTTGLMYVWFPFINDNQQSFQLEEAGGVSNTAPTVNSPSDDSGNELLSGTIGWVVIDAEDSSDDYTVYRNGSWHGSGTWNNNSNINYAFTDQPVGVWNFTIDAWDSEYNVTDTVIITVNAVDPTDNNPSDDSYTYGTTENEIGWVIIDPGSNTGTYVVYRNGTAENPTGDAWVNNTDLHYDIDGLGSGLYNYTIEYWDGNSTVNMTDLVWITVDKATPSYITCYLNGTNGNKVYTLGEMMNLSGEVGDGLVVVVEFSNGTDISTPSADTSESIEDSSVWGAGAYYIQARTEGNANYTALNSTTHTLTINPVGNTAPTVNSPSDDSGNELLSGTIGWIVTDAEDASDDYTVYRNGSWHGSGTWNNNSNINYAFTDQPVGVWNFTIDAWDSEYNVTDTVIITVNAVDPTDNNPSDASHTYGSIGNTIGWIISDAGSNTGTYVVYRNDTALNPSGSTWTDGVNINWNIDGMGASVYNYTIEYWDGNSTVNMTDLVWITVHKASPTLVCLLNGTNGDKWYNLTETINLTGTVAPVDLIVVVEFSNGTDISIPSAGSSNITFPATDWGEGVYYVRSHTDGNANYSAGNSAIHTLTISTVLPSVEIWTLWNIIKTIVFSFTTCLFMTGFWLLVVGKI